MATGDKTKELLEPVEIPELDTKVYKYMETRCQLLLKSYPTSLDEDLKLLKKGHDEFTQKQVFCYLLRSKEKEMLNGATEYCRKMLNAPSNNNVTTTTSTQVSNAK